MGTSVGCGRWECREELAFREPTSPRVVDNVEVNGLTTPGLSYIETELALIL